jgi:Mce-associated membrane protein
VAFPPAPDDSAGVTKDSSDHDSELQGEARSVSVGARRLIAVLLSLALLVSAGTLFWLVSQRSGDASDVQTQREKVMSQAQQFILRVNTYGPDLLSDDQTMPEYRDLVLEVITSKFAADFEETVPAAEATVAQAGFGRTAEVFGAGVSVIDADSATALVAGSFTNSYPDPDDESKRVDDVPLPFRVEVELVKVDGTWLVDNFTPVTGGAENPGTPGETPSGTAPSEEASP